MLKLTGKCCSARRYREGGVQVALCSLILLPVSLLAGAFDLHINDVSGLDEPWPLIGGLPFPEGELHDASQIRIIDGDGEEVAAQIDVAATWRDGSIRWALAGLTASPRGDYRVEFGPEVSRTPPPNPLRLDEAADGRLTVDTGAAAYEFLPDRFLPENARMGETIFLADSGDGAYLVDNHGRLSRVAGPRAEIETEIVKNGPVRTVIKREGWYVTGEGQRVARARMWFYLSAGSPYMRVTHSLVFTEDTNDLWVRDYGLEFRTPEAPEQVVFAHRAAAEIEKVSAREHGDLSLEQKKTWTHPISAVSNREENLSGIAPDGGEVYMLQDVYPHLLERDFRAVIGRGGSEHNGGSLESAKAGAGCFWTDHWEKLLEVAGDWGDASYGEHGLTVVMPQLAQRFPKEISFGPGNARVAFWSGRSARELDFRAVTLVDEYWQEWATGWAAGGRRRAPGGPSALAAHPSNAQGAARTHDVWLLPRRAEADMQAVSTRARAVSNPPLLQSDPKWLCGTEAIVWPMHPRDTERFAGAEEMIDRYWLRAMVSYHQLRHAGFIEWGKNITLRHAFSEFFRVSRLISYGFERYVWANYGRSGDRRYWEYGSRFSRFAGDWELAHWTAGNKFKGGFAVGNSDLPFYWGAASSRGIVICSHDIDGQTILPWLLEYYMTGDAYALELVLMVEDAYRKRWDIRSNPYSASDLHVLTLLYSREWDEQLGAMARQRAEQCIDLDNPTGIDDQKRYGSLYKLMTDVLPLYEYYHITGDAFAREAFLQGVDYMYRLSDNPHWEGHLSGAMGGRNPGILFAIAYRLTGNENYLRVVNDQIKKGVERTENAAVLWTPADMGWGARSPFANSYFLLSTPAMLKVLADADDPIEPFPVLSRNRDGKEVLTVLFHKEAERAVKMGIFLRLCEQEDKDADPEVVVMRDDSEVDVQVDVKKVFRTRNPGRRDDHGRHVSLNVPAGAPGGSYMLRLPNAQRVIVLDSDAADTRSPKRKK